jgi:ribosome-associated protein
MADPLPISDRITIPASDLEISYARSGGPGGQHVNTTDTRVRLRFALSTTSALRDDVKARLRVRARAWLTQEGDLVLTCDSTRSRLQNLDEARGRLADAIRASLTAPKIRRPTRPTGGSHQRRLTGKRVRKEVKAGRGRVRDD